MSQEIEQIVKQLNEEYPAAEFSFGYIFNHPFPVERQQWYIFTQVPTEKSASDGFVTRYKYACMGAGHQEKILADLRSDRFLTFLRLLAVFIDTPRHQWWHQKIHANDCPKCGRKPNQIGNDNICSDYLCGERYPRMEN